MHKYRTHNCNQLNKTNVGAQVKLSGFVHSKRDHGALIFIDLRDHFGITQLVVDSQKAGLNLDEIAAIKLESVITIVGEVVARAAEAVNANISTGEIEIKVGELHVESLAAQIPFQVNDNNEYPEELRLKYRFLDLRREKTHKNIVLRSQVISEIRKVMTSPELDFLEIQTPILTASSPEGARDYLVPARLHPGKFYALPQAPQQFKQLLMVSGFNRYFQIAPCFRDEDLRADRAPEFYQLDMEMSFVTQEDVFGVVEPVMKHIFNKFGVKKVAEESFPHITYEDAILKYGIDKPDLRNPIIIAEATNVFVGSGFSIFTKAIDSGSIIRAIPAPKCAAQPRSFFDKTIEFAQSVGAKGLAYINFDENGEAKGPIAKFLTPEKLEELKKIANLQNGDAVFFACGSAHEAAKIAGQVRIKLGHDLGLIDESVYKFCWIVDFPMYEISDEGKIDFSHNPFSMPQGGLEALNLQDPLTIKAFQYDVVCNGVELSSGAIRNHKPEIMYRAFELAGYGAEVVEKEFGAMLNAFKYGAPPHGGIAPGIDRIIMLLADEPNIREVIPFPMNGKAQDLMMNAPAEVSLKQLRELHIDLKKKQNS